MQRLNLLVTIGWICGCATDMRPEDEAVSSATMGPAASGTSTATSAAQSTTEADETSTGSGSVEGSEDSSSGPRGDSSSGDDTQESGSDWPEVPCVEGNESAYVLARNESQDTELHLYDPETGAVSLAFELYCLGTEVSQGPVSLAVGRDGQAFLSAATVDEVLTFPVVNVDDPCRELSSHPWTFPGDSASLTFRSEDAFNADTERLFAHGTRPQSLGWFGEVFHFAQGSPVAILGYSNRPYSDLAGTGDGQLFAVDAQGEFMTVTDGFNPAGIITGSPDVGDREFFAWGGALWVFVPGQPMLPEAAGLYRFSLDGTGTYELATAASAFPPTILSASTSTCAPTVLGG